MHIRISVCIMIITSCDWRTGRFIKNKCKLLSYLQFAGLEQNTRCEQKIILSSSCWWDTREDRKWWAEENVHECPYIQVRCVVFISSYEQFFSCLKSLVVWQSLVSTSSHHFCAQLWSSGECEGFWRSGDSLRCAPGSCLDHEGHFTLRVRSSEAKPLQFYWNIKESYCCIIHHSPTL